MILPNKQSNKSAHRTTTQSHGKMMCDAGKELNIWHTATATSTEYERERERFSNSLIIANENQIERESHQVMETWTHN